MASTISTPGITGKSGKWPPKKGSLAVTFLIPTIRSVLHLEDAIHQQQGVAMRQNLPYLVDIQSGHGNTYYINRETKFLIGRRRRPSLLRELLRAMVECESPSDDSDAVNRFVDLFADAAAPLRKGEDAPRRDFREAFAVRVRLRARGSASGQILALGHSDTVWPMGTLRTMPFREADGRLWGPGVLDMKVRHRVLPLRHARIARTGDPDASKVLLQVNSDEEVGSDSSRALTEKNARASKAVLVLEPGTGLDR